MLAVFFKTINDVLSQKTIETSVEPISDSTTTVDPLSSRPQDLDKLDSSVTDVMRKGKKNGWDIGTEGEIKIFISGLKGLLENDDTSGLENLNARFGMLGRSKKTGIGSVILIIKDQDGKTTGNFKISSTSTQCNDVSDGCIMQYNNEKGEYEAVQSYKKGERGYESINRMIDELFLLDNAKKLNRKKFYHLKGFAKEHFLERKNISTTETTSPAEASTAGITSTQSAKTMPNRHPIADGAIRRGKDGTGTWNSGLVNGTMENPPVFNKTNAKEPTAVPGTEEQGEAGINGWGLLGIGSLIGIVVGGAKKAYNYYYTGQYDLQAAEKAGPYELKNTYSSPPKAQAVLAVSEVEQPLLSQIDSTAFSKRSSKSLPCVFNPSAENALQVDQKPLSQGDVPLDQKPSRVKNSITPNRSLSEGEVSVQPTLQITSTVSHSQERRMS